MSSDQNIQNRFIIIILVSSRCRSLSDKDKLESIIILINSVHIRLNHRTI